MKKQTKKSAQQFRCVHTRTQKIWGCFALTMLFVCGVMVGLGINGNPNRITNVVTTSDTITPESTPATEPQPTEEVKQTCTLIEESLLVRLPDGGPHADTEDHIYRAQIYANLSERGCPENAQKYHDLAKQELAIARALADDEFREYETVTVVETYKRLNMQAAAEEIFETAKKLTNPAIDFILEVEKIINEQ